MGASGRMGRWIAACVLFAAAGTGGCKTLSERYIALEVWKYERCFGHLPPGFVPPGAPPPAAAAPRGRVCGQSGGCQPACPSVPMGCNDCGGGFVEGSISAAPGMPTPAGVTAGKPVVISDELVVP